jgi:hypothetical protein
MSTPFCAIFMTPAPAKKSMSKQCPIVTQGRGSTVDRSGEAVQNAAEGVAWRVVVGIVENVVDSQRRFEGNALSGVEHVTNVHIGPRLLVKAPAAVHSPSSGRGKRAHFQVLAAVKRC